MWIVHVGRCSCVGIFTKYKVLKWRAKSKNDDPGDRLLCSRITQSSQSILHLALSEDEAPPQKKTLLKTAFAPPIPAPIPGHLYPAVSPLPHQVLLATPHPELPERWEHLALPAHPQSSWWQGKRNQKTGKINQDWLSDFADQISFLLRISWSDVVKKVKILCIWTCIIFS